MSYMPQKLEKVMILTPQQRMELEAVSLPVIKWINENIHPHAIVIVSNASAEVFEASARIQTYEFIPD
jgi:hypothetical protein